ncbi:MAG: hypothetical protein IPG04_07785 [Polyangiaceae bacterium]|nr:hypothetical protein [Polyangiaceae bacterium]
MSGISFLNFLKQYRPKRPITATSSPPASRFVDANEMQIEAIGKKLRSRIDEVAGQLLVLPVYLLFTKIDLGRGVLRVLRRPAQERSFEVLGRRSAPCFRRTSQATSSAPSSTCSSSSSTPVGSGARAWSSAVRSGRG